MWNFRSRRRLGEGTSKSYSSTFELESTRLVLRLPRPEDASAVVEIMKDKFIYETTLTIPYPYSKKDFQHDLDTAHELFDNKKLLYLMIVSKATQEVMGNIHLTRVQYRFDIGKPYPIAEVGYWMGKQYGRKGYCTEACRRLFHHAFQDDPIGWGLHKIVAGHFRSNMASGKVMKNCGMKNEANFKKHMWKEGAFHDAMEWGILKEEWEEIKDTLDV